MWGCESLTELLRFKLLQELEENAEWYAKRVGRAFLGANVRDLKVQLDTSGDDGLGIDDLQDGLTAILSAGQELADLIVGDEDELAELHVHLSNATKLRCKVQSFLSGGAYKVLCCGVRVLAARLVLSIPVACCIHIQDPVCTLEVGDEKFESSVLHMTSEPEWGEQFVFRLPKLFASLQHTPLKVTVSDQSRTEIGSVALLKNTPKMVGTVELRQPDFKVGVVWNENHKLTTPALTPEEEAAAVAAAQKPKSTLTLELACKEFGSGNDRKYEIVVGVLSGSNLPFGDTDSSDPFVKLRLGSDTLKTKVIKKNVNPEWNKRFPAVILKEKPQRLLFEVYDSDMLSHHDLLGVVAIACDEIEWDGETKTVTQNLNRLDKEQSIGVGAEASMVGLELFIATARSKYNLQIYALANAISRPIFLASSPSDVLAKGVGLFGVQGLFLPTRSGCPKQLPIVLGWRNRAHESLVPLVRMESNPNKDTDVIAGTCFISEDSCNANLITHTTIHVVIAQAKNVTTSESVFCKFPLAKLRFGVLITRGCSVARFSQARCCTNTAGKSQNGKATKQKQPRRSMGKRAIMSGLRNASSRWRTRRMSCGWSCIAPKP
jgi:hypothetical protein